MDFMVMPAAIMQHTCSLLHQQVPYSPLHPDELCPLTCDLSNVQQKEAVQIPLGQGMVCVCICVHAGLTCAVQLLLPACHIVHGAQEWLGRVQP